MSVHCAVCNKTNCLCRLTAALAAVSCVSAGGCGARSGHCRCCRWFITQHEPLQHCRPITGPQTSSLCSALNPGLSLGCTQNTGTAKSLPDRICSISIGTFVYKSDYCVTPVPIGLGFWFGTALGLGLDNSLVVVWFLTIKVSVSLSLHICGDDKILKN